MNQTLIGFIKKELIQTLRDPRMRVMLFVLPVIQLTLFGVAISNEVKNIRLAAVFDVHDTVLRRIYERSIDGKWFIPSESADQDPLKLITAGDADVVLVPPPGGFTRSLGRGDAKLQILINATNVVKAQSIEAYLRNIVQQTVNDELGIIPPALPIQVSARVLFNPALETSMFLIPGVMCMIMIISTMILSTVAIVREKEMGTFEMLISAPISRSEVIYGKTIPYVLLGMSTVPLLLGVAVFAFHVPMRGPLVAVVIAAFAFICTAVALGILISTFCRNQQQAMLAAFLLKFPMLMFSGLLFPIENIPNAIRWLSFLDPLTHFMGLLRNIMLKGGETYYVVTHIAYMAVMAVISVVVSFRRFTTTLE